MTSATGAIIVRGLILGWSVAWPPGPINAEMIRRALIPRTSGGGFWAAFQLGLGACTGDFCWALGVALGAGALLASPRLHLALGAVSFCLLLFLAFTFARGAWRTARSHTAAVAPERMRKTSLSRGYFLGFILALTSPWNIGFWLAVIGAQGPAPAQAGILNSITLAVAVVSGAVAWGVVLCTALKMGARIFARPGWQIGTQVATALVMLFFAARLVWQWR
ncbi:MAG TPA: LysE family transporter [Chthoniobacterales bacterium]|jgi:threonine/homoserine/homoserine lactone efflux protein|nr:LysE family transporter [Chthoniobacterales bacterium]